MLHVNERSLRAPSFLVQLVDLALIELTNWRWAWRPMLITGVLTPLASILSLGIWSLTTMSLPSCRLSFLYAQYEQL